MVLQEWCLAERQARMSEIQKEVCPDCGGDYYPQYRFCTTSGCLYKHTEPNTPCPTCPDCGSGLKGLWAQSYALLGGQTCEHLFHKQEAQDGE